MNVGSDKDYILEFRGIGKYFPGVQALKDVSFTVGKGEILALLGENGAGKSTLMKILAGAYIKNEGEVYIDGQLADITCPEDSERLGVAIIYQEFNLIPGLTVAENIFMRRQPKKNGRIDWKRMNQMAQEIIDEIDINIRPADIVNTLTVAEQQMVEICKAVSLKSKILIMDEPTSALTESETQKLFNVVRSLNKKNVTMIFITHRMDEVFDICTNAVILRDGRFITSAPISELTLDQIIEYIVGRALTEIYPERDNKIGDVYLEVKDLTDGGKRVQPSSFVAHKGEILGFAGLVGAGRTELMRLIFGADKKMSGEILIDGKEVHIRNERDAIRYGIGLVPEDRRRQGLVLVLNVRENIIMAHYDHQKTLFYLDSKKEKQVCAQYIDKLLIKTPGQTQYAKFLSGGNQQKIAVGKWLNCDPGYKKDTIVICENQDDIANAPKEAVLIVNDYRLSLEADITALIECTGNTAVSSDVSADALKRGINVYMVSKETDSVCGTMLNQIAAENGTVYSLVNGDQPRNLLDLYSWGKLLGLDIIAAGKASEYDFVWDPDTDVFTYMEGEEKPGESIPGLRDFWHYEGTKTLAEREKLLEKYMAVISADLCEMNLVSNVTGLLPSAPRLSYPIAKTSELADIFIPEEDGGILKKTGVVDVFCNLRAPDEASFAGGEFIIVRCENDTVWELLRGKGHVVSRNGKYACIYLPYHFMGLETPVSVLLGDLMGIGTHEECRQVSVMAGVAKEDIPMGTVLKVHGHHHSIDGLVPELWEKKAAGKAAPFYLLNGMVLLKDVKKGEPVTLDAVALSGRPFEIFEKGFRLD